MLLTTQSELKAAELAIWIHASHCERVLEPVDDFHPSVGEMNASCQQVGSNPPTSGSETVTTPKTSLNLFRLPHGSVHDRSHYLAAAGSLRQMKFLLNAGTAMTRLLLMKRHSLCKPQFCLLALYVSLTFFLSICITLSLFILIASGHA